MKFNLRKFIIYFLSGALVLTSCSVQPGHLLGRGKDHANVGNAIATPFSAASPASDFPRERQDANEPVMPEQILPELSTHRPVPEPAKRQLPAMRGVYISTYTAADETKVRQFFSMMKRAKLNAIVVDVKDDFGQVTYNSHVPLAERIGSDKQGEIKGIERFVQTARQNNIIVIGRIVTFKDPFLAKRQPVWAMQKKAGGVWTDKHGNGWVDPYRPEVRRYNIDIANEAVHLGFDEIQFDYVRFPENSVKVDAEVRFYNPEKHSKAQLISAFLSQARAELHRQNVVVSADVFGLTTSTPDDMGIGQQWGQIVRSVDIICPMIYPSHYSNGMYDVQYPDLKPYAIAKRALQDGLDKNKRVTAYAPEVATIRPWFQAFTAKWLKPHRTYGLKEIEEQAKAAREMGIDEYLLWDSTSRYSMFR